MYLGLDCGTSGLKALLIDEAGVPLGSATRSYAPDRPKPNWSEQDPKTWRSAMAGAIADLRQKGAGKALDAVRAVGFSGQMHGVVLVDGDGRPERPAILHNDARAFREAAELARDRPDLASIVGVKPTASFPGPKMLWLSRHEPLSPGKTHLLLAPKDYLRLALTGEILTDMSDAAGFWLLDEAARIWSGAAADACRIDPDWLPPVVEAVAACRKDSARRRLRVRPPG